MGLNFEIGDLRI